MNQLSLPPPFFMTKTPTKYCDLKASLGQQYIVSKILIIVAILLNAFLLSYGLSNIALLTDLHNDFNLDRGRSSVGWAEGEDELLRRSLDIDLSNSSAQWGQLMTGFSNRKRGGSSCFGKSASSTCFPPRFGIH